MPRDVMTLRLDRSFRSRLQMAARRRRVTASEAARVALEGWVEAEDRESTTRPFDEIVDLIGSVRGGDRGRSMRGRERIARTLEKRHAARRPR
jgi:hypothetical protein